MQITPEVARVERQIFVLDAGFVGVKTMGKFVEPIECLGLFFRHVQHRTALLHGG